MKLKLNDMQVEYLDEAILGYIGSLADSIAKSTDADEIECISFIIAEITPVLTKLRG